MRGGELAMKKLLALIALGLLLSIGGSALAADKDEPIGIVKPLGDKDEPIG
jgi:ABC-type sugar transport system substrate-binding protein